MKGERAAGRALRIEELEPRLVLSVMLASGDGGAGEVQVDPGSGGGADEYLQVDEAKGGGAKAVGPAIRLDVVALHEMGHVLGLVHSSDPASIMYGYYNASYNVGSLANDPAVTGAGASYVGLLEVYAGVESGPWKDSLDGSPGNGVVEVTYSFMPDGTRMESGKSTLFATMDKLFRSAEVWQPIFVGALNLWESASNGLVNFVSQVDTGLAFNYFGLAQNDARAGDIRIAAHTFDGAGKVLAHAYFPPPNGWTAAGDMHFDAAENWVLGSGSSSGSSSSSNSSTAPAASGRRGKGNGELAVGELATGQEQITAILVAELSGRGERAPAATMTAGGDLGRAESAAGAMTSVVAVAPSREATVPILHRSGAASEDESLDSLFESLEMLEYPWDLDWLVLGTATGRFGAAA